jgi:hypothetical protein
MHTHTLSTSAASRLAVLLVGIVAAALAVSTLGATADAATAACKAGRTSYQGLQAWRYCGPAKATVKVAGKTLRFSGGSCSRRPTSFEIAIGINIVEHTKKPRPRFFTIYLGKYFGRGTAAAKDGTYKAVAAVYVSGGRVNVFEPTVALKGNRTRGSFDGRLVDGTQVSGTFACS